MKFRVLSSCPSWRALARIGPEKLCFMVVGGRIRWSVMPLSIQGKDPLTVRCDFAFIRLRRSYCQALAGKSALHLNTAPESLGMHLSWKAHQPHPPALFAMTSQTIPAHCTAKPRQLMACRLLHRLGSVLPGLVAASMGFAPVASLRAQEAKPATPPAVIKSAE